MLESNVLFSPYASNKLILYEYLIELAKDNLEKFNFNNQDYMGFEEAADFLRQHR